MKKVLFLILLAAAGGYWLLLTRPGLYFDKKLEYRCFTLNARGALPEKTEAVLDRVYDKLAASDFFNADKILNIYLTGGPNEFSFFAPYQASAYARVNAASGAIFIAAADFAADEVRTTPGAPARRTLSSEIAAAAAREQVRRTLKPLSYLMMDDWKLRGFSERVSGGTGEYQPADICKSEDPAMLDFKYGLVVDYAVKLDGLSMTEFMNKDYSYEKAAETVKKLNCGG